VVAVRQAQATAATVLVAVALTGCGGKVRNEVVDPTPSPSRADPIPRPTLPPGARARSEAGARAFVHYWFAALDYGVQTGDVAPLTAASAPQCAPCRRLASEITAAYGVGSTVQGGKHSIRAITAEEFSLDARPVLTVYYDRSSKAVLGEAGQIGESTPAASFVRAQVTLRRTSTGWVVADATGPEMAA